VTFILDLPSGLGIVDPIQHRCHGQTTINDSCRRQGDAHPFAAARSLTRFGVVTSRSTCRPARVAAFTSASKLNWSTLPLSNARQTRLCNTKACGRARLSQPPSLNNPSIRIGAHSASLRQCVANFGRKSSKGGLLG
jgi:hypothetical protein